MTASAALPIAAEHGVGFLPGRFFYPAAERGRPVLAAQLFIAAGARIREGIARLGAALERCSRSRDRSKVRCNEFV